MTNFRMFVLISSEYDIKNSWGGSKYKNSKHTLLKILRHLACTKLPNIRQWGVVIQFLSCDSVFVFWNFSFVAAAGSTWGRLSYWGRTRWHPSLIFIVILTLWRMFVCGINDDDDDDDGNDAVIITGSTVLKYCGPLEWPDIFLFTLLRRREQW